MNILTFDIEEWSHLFDNKFSVPGKRKRSFNDL